MFSFVLLLLYTVSQHPTALTPVESGFSLMSTLFQSATALTFCLHDEITIICQLYQNSLKGVALHIFYFDT